MNLSNKKKYVVVFVRKEQETYTFLKKKAISPTTRDVNYSKKKKHIIDLTYPTYIRKLVYYYFIDVDSNEMHTYENDKGKKQKYYGGQLRYMGSNLQYDAGILSLITDESALRQLTSTLHDKLFNGNTIILLLMGVVMGLFIGLFFGGFF